MMSPNGQWIGVGASFECKAELCPHGVRIPDSAPCPRYYDAAGGGEASGPDTLVLCGTPRGTGACSFSSSNTVTYAKCCCVETTTTTTTTIALTSTTTTPEATLAPTTT